MPGTSERRVGWSATVEIDLERLAAGYDHRPPLAETLERAGRAAAHVPDGAWALDVGGGGGAHAATWVPRCRAVVVDPAMTMARRAAGRAGVAVVRGVAQDLPLRDAAFHLVYFHLSIHYGDWQQSLREATRVLADEGRIDIWTLGPRHHTTSNLGRWFPSVRRVDESRFPDPDVMVRFLSGLGFVVERSEHDVAVERLPSEWVASVQAGFVSTLQLLDDSELRAGIEAFRRVHPDDSEPLRYALRYDRIVAVG